MTVNTYPRTCVYTGWDTIPIRTFSTTYSSFNGDAWSFNDFALQPCDCHGFVDTTNQLPIGLWYNVFDSSVAGSITNFSYGDNVVAHEHSGTFIPPPWHKNKIQGWCFGGNALQFNTLSYGAPLGANQSKSFVRGNVLNINSGSGNTGPAPFSGVNLFNGDGSGFSLSYELAFLRNYRVVKDNVISAASNIDLNLTSTTASAVNAIPFMGSSWVQINNPSGKTNLDIMNTDWSTFGNQYNITFTNPVGANFDVNTLYQASGVVAPNSTYAGFWQPFTSTITFEGMAITGWILAIMPDYSSYRIVKIVPIDATAATWTTLLGAWACKIDTTGTLWLKNANQSGILLQSGGSVLKSLPIFPPVPLPDRSELDPLPNMMRGILHV